MKHNALAAVGIASILALACLSNASAQTPSQPPAFTPGEILVRFKPNTSPDAQSRARSLANANFARRLRAIREVEVWNVPKGTEKETAKRLNADPRILYAEPNYILQAFATPNDPSLNKQWYHPIIGSPAAWDITTGSARVVIAVLDTGIDETHPDLAATLVPGHDTIDDDDTPHDLNGHGTHVAGLAAAQANNAAGIAGMVWNGAVMPVRVLGENGYGPIEDIADGVVWASNNGARILNMSLGGYTWTQTLQDAVATARNRGCLVIAAMGNDNKTSSTYPAALDGVVAVMATTQTDTKAPYSNTGPHCDLAAPGGSMSYYQDTHGIYSATPTYNCYLTTTYSYYKNYDYLQGTSQAAPLVAGLAALVWTRNPTLTADEVANIIAATAVDLGAPGRDDTFGHGRIDAAAALNATPPYTPIAAWMLH